ncbi:MAG: hypothetical protein KA338_21155 [Chloroflexi bacterium]|nr:hypothetical protein [Chloroflexota bacterium]
MITEPSKPRPTGLILLGWGVTFLQFVPMTDMGDATMPVACVLNLGALILAILLIRHQNSTAKTNGWIIFVIWLVLFVVGFLAGLAGAL